MKRRSLLAAVSTLLVAGCTRPADGGTSPQKSHEGTDFSVVASECGVVRETASVSFDGGEDTVSVEGTTSGPDACYSARLADATYDAAADEFEVVVEAYRERDGGCAQCITEIDYEATASFTGGVPGTVVVVHRSRGETRTVATASP